MAAVAINAVGAKAAARCTSGRARYRNKSALQREHTLAIREGAVQRGVVPAVVPGEGEEHVVETRLRERELGDGKACVASSCGTCPSRLTFAGR